MDISACDRFDFLQIDTDHAPDGLAFFSPSALVRFTATWHHPPGAAQVHNPRAWHKKTVFVIKLNDFNAARLDSLLTWRASRDFCLSQRTCATVFLAFFDLNPEVALPPPEVFCDLLLISRARPRTPSAHICAYNSPHADRDRPPTTDLSANRRSACKMAAPDMIKACLSCPIRGSLRRPSGLKDKAFPRLCRPSQKLKSIHLVRQGAIRDGCCNVVTVPDVPMI